MNASNEIYPTLHSRPHFLSGTSASTGIVAPSLSGKGLNTSAAHGFSFVTTRSLSRAITSCIGCEIGADAVQLVYWRPETTTIGFPNASITAPPYTMVSDSYTLSVFPLHRIERRGAYCQQYFAFGLCHIHKIDGRRNLLQRLMVV